MTLAVVASIPSRYLSSYLLTGLMLFLPLFDRRWQTPALAHSKAHYAVWTALITIGAVLTLRYPHYAGFAFITLLTAALPEEWFFRAYFMVRLGMGWRANFLSTALFSLMHGLTWGWPTALLVFIPSLFYGLLYQKTRDLILIILAHALSNLVYVLFLRDPLIMLLDEIPV